MLKTIFIFLHLHTIYVCHFFISDLGSATSPGISDHYYHNTLFISSPRVLNHSVNKMLLSPFEIDDIFSLLVVLVEIVSKETTAWMPDPGTKPGVPFAQAVLKKREKLPIEVSNNKF